MSRDDLTRALASPVILFDFDGPVCDVFAGLPAPQVACELAKLVISQKPELQQEVEATDDPMVVLVLAYAASHALGLEVEQALADAEMTAVDAAGGPTPGAAAAFNWARSHGRRVAVVSNNSAACVRAFLARHRLGGYVAEVVGRPLGRPELMKPDPYSVRRAARLLGVAGADCVLIGDSVTDVEAAHAAGAGAVGYANRPGKRAALVAAGTDAVVDRMDEIARAL